MTTADGSADILRERGPAIITFGEVMFRLSPPRRELLLQTPSLDVWLGGAEANVATALARLGHEVQMVSALPEGPLGDSALATLRSHGIDVSHTRRAEGRMGLYWVENGAGLRASEVFYDRSDSAFIRMSPAAWNWGKMLKGAGRLHVSGITPALGPNGVAASLAAVTAAKTLGVPVSFDGNYRARLWDRWEGCPRETLRQLVQHADLLFGNHLDIALLLDRRFSGEGSGRRREAAETAFAAFPSLKMIASTARHVDDVDNHRLSARVDTRGEAAETDEIVIPGIVDRMGAGDAFASGVLDGLFRQEPPARMAARGLALAALKHTIPGDAAPVSARMLDAFMAGGLDTRR